MNKKLLLGLALIFAGMLSSCGGSDEDAVKIFALHFGEMAQNNRLDSVRSVYPAAAQADSLTLHINGNVKVEKDTEENVFNVYFGTGSSITVKKAEDGTFTVTESKGIFAYPANKLELAQKTGAVKDDTPDSKLPKIMANVEKMIVELYEKNKDGNNGALKLSSYIWEDREPEYAMDVLEGYQTITNTTD